jgi:hypothetical protein
MKQDEIYICRLKKKKNILNNNLDLIEEKISNKGYKKNSITAIM